MSTVNATPSPSSTPSRHLPLAGATNFRDLGGYATQDGHIVRWRRLFRSDHLATLTDEDRAMLAGLRLQRVCDFRGVAERAELVCSLPEATVHSLAIEPTVVQGMKALLDAGATVTPALTVDLMKQTYRDFVIANSARFADMFAHLLANDSPLVFHCTAGKDRTGFAVACLLWAAGVDDAEVIDDYERTNSMLAERHRALLADLQARGVDSTLLEEMLRADRRYLAAGRDAAVERHGSLDAWLAVELGVDADARNRLRADLLHAPTA
jgi:protein-tyrosine phosphatase